MDCDEDGLVFFDGGTYSRGPSSLVEAEEGFAEDESAEEPPESREEGGALDADRERLERQLTLQVGETACQEQDRDTRSCAVAGTGSTCKFWVATISSMTQCWLSRPAPQDRLMIRCLTTSRCWPKQMWAKACKGGRHCTQPLFFPSQQQALLLVRSMEQHAAKRHHGGSVQCLMMTRAPDQERVPAGAVPGMGRRAAPAPEAGAGSDSRCAPPKHYSEPKLLCAGRANPASCLGSGLAPWCDLDSTANGTQISASNFGSMCATSM